MRATRPIPTLRRLCRAVCAAAASLWCAAAGAQTIVDRAVFDVVNFGSTWNWLSPASDPAGVDGDFHTTWFRDGGVYNGPAFNAAAPAVLGFGSINLRPVVTNIGPQPNTAYFTRAFNFNGDPADVAAITAELLADDGAFVYLNGVLAGRVNIDAAAVDAFTTRALNATNTEDATVTVNLNGASLRQGANYLAVSVHQNAPSSSDMGFDLRLGLNVQPVLSANAYALELVPRGASWRYLDTGADPGPQWNSDAFVDSVWRTGLGELGYVQPGTVTEIRFGPNESNAANDPQNKFITYYFRRGFDLPAGSDPSKFEDFVIDLQRDDGAAVYVNGQRVILDNLPANPSHNALALTAATDDGQDIQRFHLDPSLLRPGGNLIAVEVHQNGPTSSDLTFDLAARLFIKPLTLAVNTQTGLTFVRNDSGLATAIDGYTIESASRSLNPVMWFSFEDRQGAGPPESDPLGPGTSWDQIAGLAELLAEFNLGEATWFVDEHAIGLGRAFNAGPARDLRFDYLIDGEDTPRRGDVLYFTPPALPGDFNHDAARNAADIDRVSLWLRDPSATPDNAWLDDITDDANITGEDRRRLIDDLLQSGEGDADLDHVVTITDLAALAVNFGSTGGWSKGDFDGDEQVTITDLALLATRFGQVFAGGGAAGESSTPVPAPAAATVTALLTLLVRSRRTSQESLAENEPRP